MKKHNNHTTKSLYKVHPENMTLKKKGRNPGWYPSHAVQKRMENLENPKKPKSIEQ